MSGTASSDGNIIWNTSSTGSNTTASNTITFTTNGTDTGSLWYPIPDERDWLPYYNKLYQPKWHILLGYKTQMHKMWN